MSPGEFLEWEDRQELKHEYAEGEIIIMQAATLQHTRVFSNVFCEISSFLKGRRCEVLSGDLRIAATLAQSFFYPDITIFCNGTDRFEDMQNTFSNPAVIIEVMSAATRDYDLGRKQFYYMQMESVKEYIMIDSEKIRIRAARRQADDCWKFEVLRSVNDVLHIDTIVLSMDVALIYDNVGIKR